MFSYFRVFRGLILIFQTRSIRKSKFRNGTFVSAIFYLLNYSKRAK
jgi:hypothetical protein